LPCAIPSCDCGVFFSGCPLLSTKGSPPFLCDFILAFSECLVCDDLCFSLLSWHPPFSASFPAHIRDNFLFFEDVITFMVLRCLGSGARLSPSRLSCLAFSFFPPLFVARQHSPTSSGAFPGVFRVGVLNSTRRWNPISTVVFCRFFFQVITFHTSCAGLRRLCFSPFTFSFGVIPFPPLRRP